MLASLETADVPVAAIYSRSPVNTVIDADAMPPPSRAYALEVLPSIVAQT
jgi:hypothetical protein